MTKVSPLHQGSHESGNVHSFVHFFPFLVEWLPFCPQYLLLLRLLFKGLFIPSLEKSHYISLSLLSVITTTERERRIFCTLSLMTQETQEKRRGFKSLVMLASRDQNYGLETEEVTEKLLWDHDDEKRNYKRDVCATWQQNVVDN